MKYFEPIYFFGILIFLLGFAFGCGHGKDFSQKGKNPNSDEETTPKQPLFKENQSFDFVTPRFPCPIPSDQEQITLNLERVLIQSYVLPIIPPHKGYLPKSFDVPKLQLPYELAQIQCLNHYYLPVTFYVCFKPFDQPYYFPKAGLIYDFQYKHMSFPQPNYAASPASTPDLSAVPTQGLKDVPCVEGNVIYHVEKLDAPL